MIAGRSLVERDLMMYGKNILNQVAKRMPAAGHVRMAAAGLLSFLVLFLAMCIAAGNVYSVEAGETEGFEASVPGKDEKHVLTLFSYTTSWDAERQVYNGLVTHVNPSTRLDLVFMDTKNTDKAHAQEIAGEHIHLLQERVRYDAVIAVDDDALDYVLTHREDGFEGIPVIFANINSWERAQEAAADPYITGIYETFFGVETIEAAMSLYPKANRVVGISDHSLTGEAMSERFLEAAGQMELAFEILDTMELTRDEIIKKLSAYTDDTILVYLNFTQDKDGNIYGMDESYRFITDSTKLPLFKADESGIGMGVLGGCGGSYEDAGARAAAILNDALDGADLSGMGVEDMEGRYLFDVSLLGRYGISKSRLPAGSVLINNKQSFWEEYSFVLRPVIVVMLLMVIIVTLLVVDRRRLTSLVNSQKQLTDAEIRRRRAESQSNAVGHFLSSVSHDLRTPLVSIVGYTDLALNEPDEAKRTEYIEKIRKSGMLLTGLVNDTLDVSRIISGKSRINPVPTTFEKITDSVIASVSERARKKRVRFYSSIQDKNILIRADQMKLQRVILNLLTNAVKFTPEGGQVSLGIERLEDRVNGCNYRICVADNGTGMSKDFQKIMYEPFVQEHSDPLHLGVQEGTGLGLTIVRNNVEQMGGFIDIQSEEGKGTKVSVYLPIDVRNMEPVREKEENEPDYSALNGMKVLIAEDSDMNMEVIRAILSRKGVVCECVSDGKQAVDAFEQAMPGTYAVILMDLRMPGMNGYEAVQRIRSMDREDAHKIPIYALSADVYEEDVKRAKNAGMNGHIAKPIRPERLYEVLLEASSG